MKKVALCLIGICLLFIFYPNKSNAAPAACFSFNISDPEKSANAEAEAKAKAETKVKTLFFRLNEIKRMDKSMMNSSDKKKLRIETRSIKQEIRKMYQGQYPTVGSRIMIELLLMI